MVWIALERKSDVDRFADVVVVLDLGIGEGGSAGGAPEGWAEAFIDVAFLDQASEDAYDLGFEPKVHCRVRFFPKAEDAKPFELVALDGEVFGSVIAAGLTEFRNRRRDLLFRELLHHCLLDGQTVVIESRNVRGSEAHHLAAFQHKILEDFVHRGSDVDGRVCIRRAVMEHVTRRVLSGFLKLVINRLVVPDCLDRRLQGRQVRLHGDCRFSVREMESRFEVHLNLTVYRETGLPR